MAAAAVPPTPPHVNLQRVGRDSHLVFIVRGSLTDQRAGVIKPRALALRARGCYAK